MSDIKRRTLFYENGKEGEMRFHDWALVTTELGSMMEPFIERISLIRNTKAGFVDYDATEPMCRIDELRYYSLDRGLQILGDTCCGGRLMPRIGR
jgi:hypothetical protein